MEVTEKLLLKNKIVPKLRFRGFNEPWAREKLSSLTTKISDGLHSTPIYTENGEYYFVNGNNLINGNIVINENTKRVNKQEYTKHKKELNEKTILLSINGTIGSLAFYNNEKIILGKSACYINLNDRVDKYFIYNSLQINSIISFFNSELTGSTIKNLSLTTIKNCEFILPALPEQQKIASFLSAVDKKIQQLTRKKELLEKYKKGVMQQLFSGKLRFKDEKGKDYPEWEEKMYGEVFSFYSTNSFSRDNLNYSNGKVKNIHYGDIHTKFSTLLDISREQIPFINQEINISRISEQNYCREGDLIVADASEDLLDVGKTVEIVKLNNEKVLAGLHTFLARPDKRPMSLGFSGYLVKANYIRNQIMKIAQGSKVSGLSIGRLSTVKIKIPTVEEQRKISNFLIRIDSKIDIVTVQINRMNLFKKGLLQQMFV